LAILDLVVDCTCSRVCPCQSAEVRGLSRGTRPHFPFSSVPHHRCRWTRKRVYVFYHSGWFVCHHLPRGRFCCLPRGVCKRKKVL